MRPEPKPYAAGTKVPVSKSQDEIRKMLEKHACSEFEFYESHDRMLFQFWMSMDEGRRLLRFDVPKPDRSHPRYQGAAYEQEMRQRWRLLKMSIQARLHEYLAGVWTFEEIFSEHVVMPNNQTFGEWARDLVKEAYDTGQIPEKIMPALPEGKRR